MRIAECGFYEELTQTLSAVALAKAELHRERTEMHREGRKGVWKKQIRKYL
jgi:hypothetical protein